MWWIFVLIFSASHNLSDAEEYCFTETFQPQCNASSVILMTTALYGRLDVGRCIANLESLGCYNDVITYMDYMCSGRRSCTVSVLQLEMASNAPCLKDYKNYLEAEYTCETVNDDYCSVNESRVLEFLPNTMAIPNGTAGTELCPWRVAALPGQRIVLDLLDITLSVAVSEIYDNKETSMPCPVFITVKDSKGHTDLVYLCSINTRQRKIYTSRDNTIDFYMNINATLTRTPVYMFTYSIQGCPSLIPPNNTRIKVDTSSAEIYCNFTGDTWYLVCKDNAWVGILGNCTEPEKVSPRKGSWPLMNYPYAILFAVAIGIAAGVIIGITLLGIVVGFRRCQKNKSRKKQQKFPDLSTIEIPALAKKMDRELLPGSSHRTECPEPCPNLDQNEQGQRDMVPPPPGHGSTQEQHTNNCSDLWQMSRYRVQHEMTGVMPCPVSCDQTENPPRPQIMSMYPLLEKTRNLQKQQQLAENNDYDTSGLQPSDKQYQIKVELHSTRHGGENVRY